MRHSIDNHCRSHQHTSKRQSSLFTLLIQHGVAQIQETQYVAADHQPHDSASSTPRASEADSTDYPARSSAVEADITATMAASPHHHDDMHPALTATAAIIVIPANKTKVCPSHLLDLLSLQHHDFQHVSEQHSTVAVIGHFTFMKDNTIGLYLTK